MDERISRVLALEDELRRALEARDLARVDQLYAPEFTLNSPANRLQTRQETLEILAKTNWRQEGFQRDVEAAYVSGDVVVTMGRESLTWRNTGTDRDDRPTERRYTNAWRLIAGEWRQIMRHASTISSKAP